MQAIIEELIVIMSKEIEAFNDLLGTLHLKQRAIVEGEVERLNQTVQDETKLARETKALEGERIERTRELAKKLHIKNANPRLTEIIEKVEEQYAHRLQEQRDLLRSLVEKIHNLNQGNQFLLNYSLKFVEKTMEILFNGNDKSSLYKKDGQLQKSMTKNRIFDHSV
jgi:flagellar biosynthesis/type III secretory pathway chaperone